MIHWWTDGEMYSQLSPVEYRVSFRQSSIHMKIVLVYIAIELQKFDMLLFRNHLQL